MTAIRADVSILFTRIKKKTYKYITVFSTYVMDEFSLQEANRFQCEQVVEQEGVGIFESTDDTSEEKGHRCINVRVRGRKWGKNVQQAPHSLPVSVDACLWSIVFCVTSK